MDDEGWDDGMGSDQPQSFPFDNASFDHAATAMVMAVAAFFNYCQPPDPNPSCRHVHLDKSH